MSESERIKSPFQRLRERQTKYHKTREYREFAEPAREAGFTVEQRKSAIRDGEHTLLRDASKTVRQHIDRDELISLFRFLRPGRLSTFLDIKEAVNIGNALYDFGRDTKENIGGSKLNEQEVRLFNLACVMIEDAFYDGRLLNLPSGRAAALTHIINGIAKILMKNRNDTSLIGFNIPRFHRFLRDVARFEAQSLFPTIEKEKGSQVSDAGFRALGGSIEIELAHLEAIEQHPPPLVEMAEELEKALPILAEDPQMDPEYFPKVRGAMAFFIEQSKHVESQRIARTEALLEDAQNPYSEDIVLPPLTLPSNRCTYADLALSIATSASSKQNNLINRLGAVINRGSNIQKAHSEPERTQLQTLISRLSTLFRPKVKEYVPSSEQIAARNTLQRFVSEPVSEKYAIYLQAQLPLYELVKHRNELRRSDTPFREATQILGRNMGGKHVVAYFIKSCLIAQDKLNKTHNTKELFAKEAEKLRRESEERPSYFFSSGERRKSVRYAKPHYEPYTMICALWAIKYLNAR